ncbi:MAG TPA: hypothetical protein DF984_06875 [Anaerolineaceae bacterium]|nr:hypothetical protein [Anaerolineaceae bacterium]
MSLGTEVLAGCYAEWGGFRDPLGQIVAKFCLVFGIVRRIVMTLYISIKVLSELLPLGGEMRVVEVQEDCAFFDPFVHDGVSGVTRLDLPLLLPPITALRR